MTPRSARAPSRGESSKSSMSVPKRVASQNETLFTGGGIQQFTDGAQTHTYSYDAQERVTSATLCVLIIHSRGQAASRHVYRP